MGDIKAANVNPFYVPSKWESRVDRLVGLFSPSARYSRQLARQKTHYQFHYLSAKSQDLRKNSSPNTVSGETMRGNQERKQMMWNSIELIENSGLAWRIRSLFCNYVCGTLRYQARSGDKAQNKLQEDFLKVKLGKACDLAGKRTFRQHAGLIVSGQVIKGDAGINFVRRGPRGGELYIQGIEGDRIGHPYDYRVSRDFIGGIHLDDDGAYQAFDIYTRDRKSQQYYFEQQIPAYNEIGLPNFLLAYNPITFDDIRGRTVFARTLDKIAYLNAIRDYELQAQEWAASQSGVYFTKSGLLPDSLPFEQAASGGECSDQYGQVLTRFGVKPNTITAMGIGEEVKMFEHDRPSPNVQAMYKETVRDIAIGTDLSFGFVYDLSGVNGTAVRFYSSQDKRAIEVWQENLEENALDTVVTLMLGDAIARNEIPWHPNWMRGSWIFPAHVTVDAGRESMANIAENAAGLRSGQDIVAEDGGEWEETTDQISIEVRHRIQRAKEIANEEGIEDWREVMDMMGTGKRMMLSASFEAARAEQNRTKGNLNQAQAEATDDPEKVGASSGGVDLE